MADMSKLAAKRKSTLGAPPPPEEASPNLAAPETAPAPAAPVAKRTDGRSARRSNRTIQFATRVTPEFDERIRAIAERDGLLLVQVLERALDAYETSR
jgi:hypothetical protein